MYYNLHFNTENILYKHTNRDVYNNEYFIKLGVGYKIHKHIRSEVDFGLKHEFDYDKIALHKTNNNIFFGTLGIGYFDSLNKNTTYFIAPQYTYFRDENNMDINTRKSIFNSGGDIYGVSFSLNHPLYKKLGLRLKLIAQRAIFPSELNY